MRGVNPLTLMRDQDRISLQNINTVSSNENKEKYQSIKGLLIDPVPNSLN